MQQLSKVLSGENGHHFTGEFIGTAILVFFGCGSVATSILFNVHSSLWQIAMIWGVGVALAIYATRHLSCAHLNPAVSVAMAISGRMKYRLLPVYLTAQFLGAFVAAALLYLLFTDTIAHFEAINGILRGSPESVHTAMMFGEFYPNPGAGSAAVVSTTTAFLAEAIGTFALVFMIFSLTEGCNLGRPDNALAPLFIGATVAIIIAVIAPLTQAGLNPARDLGPRIFSVLAGWEDAALPGSWANAVSVYLLGPIFGGLLAGGIFTRIIEPMMQQKISCERCHQE